MLTVEDGEITDEYDEFIDIEEILPPKIIKLTGITNEMIEKEGKSESEVAGALKERIEPGTLMIAHNAQFDLSFIYELLRRNYPHEADGIVRNAKWLDTLTVLKDRKNYPHKLCDAVSHYNLGDVNYHRAIDDTRALYRVTHKMIDERNDLMEYVNVFGFNPKYGISGKRFDFIRYAPQKYHNRGFLPENRILPKI